MAKVFGFAIKEEYQQRVQVEKNEKENARLRAQRHKEFENAEKEERARQATGAQFNVITVNKGRKPNSHDLAALAAKEAASLARTLEEKPLDSPEREFTPFCTLLKKQTQLDYKLRDAKAQAEYQKTQALQYQEEEYYDNRPPWSSKPSKKAPDSQVLRAREAKEAAELAEKREPDSVPPTVDDSKLVPWHDHFTKPPSSFDLISQSARLEKQRELQLQQEEYKQKLAFFYDDSVYT